MAVKLYIPTPLRHYVGQADKFDVEGKTVGEALSETAARFRELR